MYLAQSSGGQKIYSKLDTLLLQMISADAWVRGVTGGIRDEGADEVLFPVNDSRTKGVVSPAHSAGNQRVKNQWAVTM